MGPPNNYGPKRTEPNNDLENEPKLKKSKKQLSQTSESLQNDWENPRNRFLRRLLKKEVSLTNVRRIEAKVYQGEEITDFEIHHTDLDKVLSEH